MESTFDIDIGINGIPKLNAKYLGKRVFPHPGMPKLINEKDTESQSQKSMYQKSNLFSLQIFVFICSIPFSKRPECKN